MNKHFNKFLKFVEVIKSERNQVLIQSHRNTNNNNLLYSNVSSISQLLNFSRELIQLILKITSFVHFELCFFVHFLV